MIAFVLYKDWAVPAEMYAIGTSKRKTDMGLHMLRTIISFHAVGFLMLNSIPLERITMQLMIERKKARRTRVQTGPRTWETLQVKNHVLSYRFASLQGKDFQSQSRCRRCLRLIFRVRLSCRLRIPLTWVLTRKIFSKLL